MRLVIGILSTALVAGNVVVNCIPLFVMGLVRVTAGGLGFTRTEARLAGAMDRIIDSWVVINRFLFRALGLTRIQVHWSHAEELSRDRWYMVVSNHQSWTDILVLQNTLFEHIPPLKFFTKRQLLWVPFLGQAMWLLDFPYVRRMSREKIASNPELLRLDREATAQACARIRRHPTSVLNFLEGTRFTAEKHDAQPEARFVRLLNPKSGGLSQVLAALNDKLYQVVDVTIDYPAGVPTFWEFMQGRCPRVDVDITCRDIPEAIRAADDDEARRRATAEWVEALWIEKDGQLTALHPTGAIA